MEDCSLRDFKVMLVEWSWWRWKILEILQLLRENVIILTFHVEEN